MKENNMDLLEHLNTRQKEAVTNVKGPLLVIAGAGSGKTRVLTYRIAYLIGQCGIKPSEILAVTFTNKAAQEMKDRVADLVGSVGKSIWVSTFHSTCVQILRSNAEYADYKRNFQIFDSSDQRVLIKDCLKQLNLDPKRYEPNALLAAISHAKNQLLSPTAYEAKAADFWQKQVSRVYSLYQVQLKTNNGLDFDDLITQTVWLLQRNPQVCSYYQERFKYILVDEYQDTNHAQYQLVNLLATKYKNLCVVGDDDQSIYAFRGADIRNILEFEHDYPQAKVIRLEHNYRSTQNILEAANNIIKNNQKRKGKELYTHNNKGDKIRLFQAENERVEARFIAEVILKDIENHSRYYQDFTILYRTHAQSRIIEEEFVGRHIPYRIVSGLRFYDRKEIKDLMAYLRLIANPQDNYSFRRIVNVPRRGIGSTTLAKVETFAQSRQCSLFEALSLLDQIESISGKYQKSLEGFYALILEFQQKMAQKNTITSIVESILQDSNYLQYINTGSPIEAETRIENINEFISLTSQFDQEEGADLQQFLEKLALMSDADNYDRNADMVSLMTIHAAKGLEFPVVFLVGMEDGVFPSARSLWEPGQIEEERRLAYVGLTRAREQLYLTCAKQRTLLGNTTENQISTFVQEIPGSLLDTSGAQHSWLQGLQVNNNENQTLESIDFEVGDQVRHRHFGEGKVVEVRNDIISIRFHNKEIKQFAASLAPLVKI